MHMINVAEKILSTAFVWPELLLESGKLEKHQYMIKSSRLPDSDAEWCNVEVAINETIAIMQALLQELWLPHLDGGHSNLHTCMVEWPGVIST